MYLHTYVPTNMHAYYTYMHTYTTDQQASKHKQGDELDSGAYVSFDEPRPEIVEEMRRKSVAMGMSMSDSVEELKRNDCVKPEAGETFEDAKQKLLADLEEHDQANAAMTELYSKFDREDGQLHNWLCDLRGEP